MRIKSDVFSGAEINWYGMLPSSAQLAKMESKLTNKILRHWVSPKAESNRFAIEDCVRSDVKE